MSRWRQDVQWHTGDAVLLCEANVELAGPAAGVIVRNPTDAGVARLTY